MRPGNKGHLKESPSATMATEEAFGALPAPFLGALGSPLGDAGRFLRHLGSPLANLESLWDRLVFCLLVWLVCCLCVCLFVWLVVWLFVWLFVCLFACMYVCLFDCLIVCMFV